MSIADFTQLKTLRGSVRLSESNIRPAPHAQKASGSGHQGEIFVISGRGSHVSICPGLCKVCSSFINKDFIPDSPKLQDIGFWFQVHSLLAAQ